MEKSSPSKVKAMHSTSALTLRKNNHNSSVMLKLSIKSMEEKDSAEENDSLKSLNYDEDMFSPKNLSNKMNSIHSP